MDKKSSSSRDKAKRSGSGYRGFSSPDTIGTERVSVRSFEEKSRRDSMDYSTARSRKHRRREERGNGKYLWLSVAAVVGAYVALLAFHTLTYQPPVQSMIVMEEPEETTRPPATPVLGTAQAVSLANQAPVAAIISVSNLIEDVDQARDLTREAQNLIRKRRYLGAQTKLLEAVRLAPNMYEALIELAKVLQDQKEDLLARDILLRAVSVDPESMTARMMLSQTFFRLKEYDNALATALWALRSQPYSEEAHQVAADVYTALSRHDAAIYHWKKITSLNSNNRAAKNSLGLALLSEGQLTEAINQFQEVIEVDEGNSQAHYYLAISFIRRGDPEMAVNVLANAASILGIQFVKAWARSAEFSDLRELPSFQKNFSNDGVPIESDDQTTGL